MTREEVRKSTTTAAEDFDAQLERERETEQAVWRNKINQNNFDALQQIDKLWERTERTVEALVATDEQKVVKDRAKEFITKGKEKLRIVLSTCFICRRRYANSYRDVRKDRY